MTKRERETDQCRVTCDKSSSHFIRRSGSEKGVVLVVVLILSAVALTIMTALIYMITSGTQISGFQKKYKSALEAGQGGAELFYQFIATRSETLSESSLLSTLNGFNLNAAIFDNVLCEGSVGSAPYTGFDVKLLVPSASWGPNCNRTVAIKPNDTTTYDMRVDLGTNPTYRVYAKIIATTEGNSSGDEGLSTSGVVAANTGEVAVMSMPFLYTIEVDAENSANPQERAKFSILYQY